MQLISLDGETIVFNVPSKCFFVFDILYCEDLKKFKDFFEDVNFIFNLKQGNIEYCYVDLALYFIKEECNALSINISDIKNYTIQLSDVNLNSISTDTGVIALVDKSMISLFLDLFSYDDFVDTLDTLTFPTELIKYLDMLNKNLSNNFAIISTPGIDKGFDFTGSGSYIIKNDCIKSH